MTFAHTHAHAHDPDTSHDAARRARRLVAQHKFIILNTLRLAAVHWLDHPLPSGLTSNEIAQLCELDYLQVARRIKDLKDDGKVEDSGQRRASPGGRKASVWRLT